ncbi:MAG TPA: 4-hydroxy-tetrahydrodipicolinate synthase [Candidatus Ornithoclostridium excrementipullorum]|nr:4-hydroxy-tetrahydrodipicolinate synthase [Candidatus Ornithoclostridium excrementipullorum]
MFKGLGTALITPFEEDGRIDYASLEKLICAQLDAGVNALVICGTTGEPPAMTDTERSDVIRFAVRTVAGRIPVIAGTGSNCTASAAANSRRAEELGADGVLVVTPYYNKCTQDGLFLHYRTVAESTSLPVIAYNVPGRTGVNLLPSTAARLTEIPNLAGIKEASGNITQVINIAKAIEGSNISLFSGDDPAALPIFAVGGVGLISVASNAVPARIKELTDACLAGDYATARKLQYRYQRFFELMFAEVNPIPIKAACALLGLCKPYMRLPLTQATDATTAALREEMKKLSFIEA